MEERTPKKYKATGCACAISAIMGLLILMQGCSAQNKNTMGLGGLMLVGGLIVGLINRFLLWWRLG